MERLIETSTYCILNNVDESILKLNPIISSSGYEFVAVSLHDLELQFSEVFGISRTYKPTQDIIKSFTSTLDGKPNTVSKLFDDAVQRYFSINQYGNEYLETSPDHEIYLLKKTESSITERGDSYTIRDYSINNVRVFANKITRRLRLFKEGQIQILGYFSIGKLDREVFHSEIVALQPLISPVKFSLTDAEIVELKKYLHIDEDFPEWLKFCLESFEASYDIYDKKLRFVVLMIAIENIFNKDKKDPIRHIISRHSALLISKSREEFDKNYKGMQKLYDIRCNIVHGNDAPKAIRNLKVDLDLNLEKLDNLLRQVIQKCIWFEDIRSKEMLFEYLNQKGFSG
jgi:hypothetical protein